MKKQIKLFSYFFVFSVILILDRLTKVWAKTELINKDIELMPLLNFSLSFNRGITFSLFHYSSDIAFKILGTVIGLIIALFFIYTIYMFKSHKNILPEILVLSGAISNFVDRCLYGGVVDFIDFYFKNLHFPTFNIADSAIVIGVVLIIWRNLLYEHA